MIPWCVHRDDRMMAFTFKKAQISGAQCCG